MGMFVVVLLAVVVEVLVGVIHVLSVVVTWMLPVGVMVNVVMGMVVVVLLVVDVEVSVGVIHVVSVVVS